MGKFAWRGINCWHREIHPPNQMCLFKAAGKRAGLWRSGGCRNRAGEQDQGPPNQMAEAARRMEGGKGGQGTESRPGCRGWAPAQQGGCKPSTDPSEPVSSPVK